MRYLFVMAYPDDEADVGGMIWNLTEKGHQVAVAVTVGKAAARRNLSDSLASEEKQSMALLGVSKVFHADFPNIRLNAVPHGDIMEFLKDCMEEWGAEAVVTHHTADVNIDHAVTGKAALSAAVEYSGNGKNRVKLFLMCETAGATEWALDASCNRFEPDYYFEIGREGLDRKIQAHECYDGVMRPFPHPQSHEVYEGLAALRGAQSGCEYAEAFQCVYCSM